MSGFGFKREQLRSPLARRLIVAIILFSSTITLVLTSLQLYGEYRGQLKEIDGTFRQIENSHLESLTHSLWTTDLQDLRLQLTGIARLPNLEYAAVREGAKLWAEAGRQASGDVIERQFAMTYLHLGRVHELGTLTVVAGLGAIYRGLIVRAFVVLASNAVKTFLVAGLAFALFQWMVNRHLTAIAGHLHGLEPGKRASPLLLARAAGARPDELDEVVAAANFLDDRVHSMHAALRESEVRFRSLTELSADWYWEQDADLRFTALSDLAEQRSGLPVAGVIGLRRWEMEGARPLSGGWEEHRATLQARQPFRDFEYVRTVANCRPQYISVSGEPIFDHHGHFAGYRGVAYNITDRKLAERGLQESAENLRSLSRRLVSTQEEQRRALARELHDRVGQNLTALAINLEILRGADGRAAPGEFERRIRESAELTEATGRIIADVTAELRPPMLDEYGLAAALRWYGEQQAARTGLRVEVRGPQGDGPAPRIERDLPIFRIAQEAFNNVIKHAHASRVEIALIEGAQGLMLSVRDYGRGLDAESEARARERMGMRTMRERATAIGAHFEFGPAPGGGMIVRVRVAP